MKKANLIFIIGCLTYLILLGLAYVFYQERTLFADLAFHLFHILREGTYAIQNERFGAFFTQSVPLLGSWWGISLKPIVIAYSLVFVVYYFTIFLINWKVLGNHRMGLCMLLLSTLMVSDTFYWIQSEYPQGLAFMLLFFALISKSTNLKKFSIIEYLLLPPLIITVAYFHPLIFIPFTFICLFFYLSKEVANTKLLIGSFAFFVLVLLLKNTLLKTHSEYEAKSMAGIMNFIKLFPNYFLINKNYTFGQSLLTDFYFLPIGLGLISFQYIKQKHWLKMGLVWSFFLGYLLLINVSFSPSNFIAYYMENLYLPLALMVSVPLVYDWLPKRTAVQQALFVGAICVAAVIRIGWNHTIYTERLVWQKDFLAKTEARPNKKLIVPSYAVPKEKLLLTLWSSPYEFWLLSSLDTADSRSIVIHPNPMERFSYELDNLPDAFYTYWGNFSYQDLDKRYFHFEDTSLYEIYYPIEKQEPATD